MRKGWLFCTALVLASVTLTRGSGPVPTPARPNVVLITIDTLRADRLGCQGHRAAQTPNVDALARESLHFKTAVAQVPLTLPSHCTILTGMLPTTHQVRDNVGYRLASSQLTMAEILKAAGYGTCAAVGSYVLHSNFGLDQGFGYYDNVSAGKTGAIVNLNQLERRASEVVNKGIAWLRQNGKSSFFLWLHLYDPHDPYSPPAPFDMRFKGRGYDGEIAYCDQEIGRLLHFLREQALYANTVIVVTSDHGESFGEHGEYTHGYFLYDSTLLVPLIIKPAGTPRPAVVSAQVSTVDILPTVLDILKLRVPAGIQGRSLLAAVDGRRPAVTTDAYSETYYPAQFGWSTLRSLRRSQVKFIQAPKPELYEIARDPAELRNVQAQKPSLRAEMEKRLAQLAGTGREPTSATMILSREERDRLAALGYVSGTAGGAPDSVRGPDPKDKLQIFNLVSEAGQAAARGRCQEAIPKLRQILAREPNMGAAHLLLGRCLYEAEQFEAARSSFSKVLEGSPGNVDALFFLAACDYYLKRLEQAEAGLKRVVAAAPGHLPALKYLGFVYQARGQMPAAVAAFQKAATINPEDEEAHAKLGFLFASQSRFAEAVAHYSKAAKLNPNNAATRFNLGLALMKTGQADKGQAELKEACRLDKQYCR